MSTSTADLRRLEFSLPGADSNCTFHLVSSMWSARSPVYPNSASISTGLSLMSNRLI